jgi:hypothetical protein
VISSGFLASQATAALQVMVLPFVALNCAINAAGTLEDMSKVSFGMSMLVIYFVFNLNNCQIKFSGDFKVNN